MILPDNVRLVLQARQDTARSSTAKLKSMLEAACSDDRARGMLLYHGASTGRWTGKLCQPQNFPRGEIGDAAKPKNEKYLVDGGAEALIPAVLSGDYRAIEEAAPPLAVISSLLRAMFRAAPGHRFMSGDFSQIEARVLGWLAGEPFNNEAYEQMASAIYRVPVEEVQPNQRQVGKMAELGCGYGMGWKKFRDQTKVQAGIDLSDELAQTAVNTYRAKKAGIPNYWRELDKATRRAVRKPGSVEQVGPIKWSVRGEFLWCILPSKRPLAYALPQIDRDGVSFCGVNSVTRKWQRRNAYGGLWAENITQAVARDIMAEAMLRVEEAGYPLVLSVHDELLAAVPNDHGSLDEFLALMKRPPPWLTGCDLEVDGWEGERYRK